MEKEIIWYRNIRNNLQNENYQKLDELCASVDYCLKEHILLFINEAQYKSDELWNWLYDPSVEQLNDIKRELAKYIQKSEPIDDDEYTKKESDVGKCCDIKIIIACANRAVYGFCSLSDFFYCIQSYLSMEKKDDFIKDLGECFPNLFFVDDIGSSINSLNRKFDEIKGEIVNHLRSLDDFTSSFNMLRRNGESNRRLAESFQAATGIECSTQGGRESVEKLKTILYNSSTKNIEEVCCELHTKFKRFNIDRNHQDRIYFYPGKEELLEGKTVIKHIGTHL